MGTILPRKRKDGSTGYTAQIRIKRDGKIVYTEAQTFEREQAAKAWIKRRETELAAPGALDDLNRPDPTLADAIDKYITDSNRALGKTKTQVLRSLKSDPITELHCSEIGSPEIIALAKRLIEDKLPQTVANYISHLSAIFTIARPAWGYPLDEQAMRDAAVVLKRLGTIAKSNKRERRPTLPELDIMMEHFGAIRVKRPDSADMQKVIAVAIYSTRRLGEITRIEWPDLDERHSRVLVRDLKHPGEKIGNDMWCDLPPEALAIIQSMPRVKGEKRIFPYNPKSISTAFTRAMNFLGIEDLDFHDMRHHGISRLFEMGQTIPQVAMVSAHRSWTSLKRYTHLRQVGDCMEGWKWLPIILARNGHSNE